MSSLRNRVLLVVRHHYQRCDSAPMVLADLHHLAEKLFLTLGEQMATVAGGESLFGAHGQRDQLRFVVRILQVTKQMAEIIWIAYRNQFARHRSQPQPFRLQLCLIVQQVEVELLQLLAVRVRMSGGTVEVLRDLEDHEQGGRERYPRDRRYLFGEKVDYGYGEQQQESECKAQGKVDTARPE